MEHTIDFNSDFVHLFNTLIWNNQTFLSVSRKWIFYLSFSSGFYHSCRIDHASYLVDL